MSNAAVKVCQQCRSLLSAGVLGLCRADALEVEHLKERLDRLSGLVWSVATVAGRAETVEKEEVNEK